MFKQSTTNEENTMNGTIREHGDDANIVTVLQSSFTDTTVTIELTEKSATVLGFGKMAVTATIPKSAVFDIADKCLDTGTTLIFG